MDIKPLFLWTYEYMSESLLIETALTIRQIVFSFWMEGRKGGGCPGCSLLLLLRPSFLGCCSNILHLSASASTDEIGNDDQQYQNN